MRNWDGVGGRLGAQGHARRGQGAVRLQGVCTTVAGALVFSDAVRPPFLSCLSRTDRTQSTSTVERQREGQSTGGRLVLNSLYKSSAKRCNSSFAGSSP